MKKQKICANCGAVVADVSDENMFYQHIFCNSCLERETVVCSNCGRRIWNYDACSSEDSPECPDCFDSNDNYSYDDDDDDVSSVIYDYSYKPEPIFYGSPTDNRYFGVELEVDDGGERSSGAEKILFIANKNEERIYCKHDGSLHDGFEIVTHPMTLDYHENEMEWEEVTEKLKKMGYLSHQANTCGLHIHVNRTTFGKTEREQDEVIARILYFSEKFWDELLKFSRRTEYQLQQWAARYGYKDQPKEILHHAKTNKNERYTHINLTNDDTIEFRMFRGTLKYNTIIATLQLVNRVCDEALFLSDDELKKLSWTTFVSECSEPELIQYLKERRLYVNEPVACEEEI